MGVDVQTAARSKVLKALADPVRWEIVQRLAEEELCVCHLVEDLQLSQPLVSHHLKTLRDVGVVDAERFKQWTYHRLVPAVIVAVADDLRDVGREAKRSTIRRRACC